jgi:hypothetical protein
VSCCCRQVAHTKHQQLLTLLLSPPAQVVTAIIQRKSDGKLLLVKRSDQVQTRGRQSSCAKHQPAHKRGVSADHCVSAPVVVHRSAATSSTGAA